MKPFVLPIASSVVVAVVGVFAVVADLQTTIDFSDKYIRPLLSARMPLWAILLVLLVGASGCYFWVRRTFKSRQTEELSILSEGQFLSKLHILLVTARRSVKFIGLTKDWIFPLILSIFIARGRGVRLDIVCTDGEHERYKLLERMGCSVERVVSIPIVGVLSDPDEILHCRAVFRCPRSRSENIVARYYYGSLDWCVINSCDERLRSGLSIKTVNQEGTVDYTPELVEVTDEVLFARLRDVRVYEGAKFESVEIEINNLMPISKQVLKYKLLQIDHLLHVYETKGWSLFRPCGIRLANKEVSLLVPPVIESHGGRLCITEGHTRLYRLREKGVRRVRVVVVKDVAFPLPMEPTTWSKVAVVDDKTERRDSQLARYIETSTHRNIWI